MNESNIRFTDEQYAALRQSYRRWWANESDRPIVPIITTGHPSSRQPSPYPTLQFPTAWDFSIRPEQFVDAHDWHFSTMRWYGDAFPMFPTTAFGPGVLAAFLGCTPVGAPSTVWFQPPREDIPIEELHFEYDENNPYFRRVLNVYEAAMDKWHGQVVVGMVDMGGVMDVLQSFRGAENLLMDLYDSPDEVLRCVREIQELWFVYYDKFNSMMAPEARGYSQWFNLYGEEPGYILQSDFSYMIGPEMFRTFVAPELASSAARLKNAVYHMDGIGQIPHLDQLLAIRDIKGIQWVHGAGTPELTNWDELLEKILASGVKLLSCNQRPDGTPTELSKKNPGQHAYRDWYFRANEPDRVKAYAAQFGMEIDI